MSNILAFGTFQGLIIGLALATASCLLVLVKKEKHQWPLTAILIVFITPLALSGFWYSLEPWGISDWDFYFSLHHTWRDTILTHHQFPLWNPATCGGTAGLAEPEFSVLTPTFLLELIFGIEKGLRLAIFFATAVGALGMLALSKSLKLTPLAGLLTATAYAFGSINLLEIVEGHVNIFSAMYIPWIFWSWLLAYRKKLNPMACGLLLALTFYQGGIYLLMYTAFAFLFLPLLTKNPQQAYKISIISGLWALGLAAFKLIPVFFWLQQFQDTAYASSANTLANLNDIFLGRHLHGLTSENIIPNQGGGWHEYGAYLGLPIIFAAILGIIHIKKSFRIIGALIIASIVAILISSSGPVLKPLFDIAPFIPRSNISRFVLFAVIPLTLLAAHGLSFLQKKSRAGFIFAYLIFALASIDLISLAYPLSQQAFIVPKNSRLPTPAKPPLEFIAHTYDIRVNNVDISRSYSATLAGYGTLNYCTSLGPKPSIRTIHDEGSNNIVNFHKGEITHIGWSPNKVHVTGTASKKTDLNLNTNYAKGWTVNNQPAKNIADRVATQLPPGDFDLTFKYTPPGIIFGGIISLATIVCACITISQRQKPPKTLS